MSINHLSDNSRPTKYLNPNFNNCISSSLKLDGSNVSGYNATTVNNYEEYDNLLVEMKDEFNGVIVKKFEVFIQRFGNFVNIFFDCSGVFNVINTSTYISNVSPGIIPDRFRPKNDYYVTGLCDNGASKLHIGKIFVKKTGDIEIYLDYEKNKKWDNTQNNKFYGFDTIYKV